MPSYKTLVQILIATSVASSAVAAPVIKFPEEGGSHTGKRSESSTSAATHEAAHEHPPLSQTPPPVYSGHSGGPPTYPPQTLPPDGSTHPPQTLPPDGSGRKFTTKQMAGSFGSGILLGGFGTGVTYASVLAAKNAKGAKNDTQNSTSKRSVEDGGHISRSLANLNDEHLRFLRDISHWARALEGLD